MKLARYLTFISLLLTTSALALPLLHSRGQPGAVYFCTGKAWGGTCWWQAPYDLQTWICTNLEENMLVRSFGPDPGAECKMFEYVISTVIPLPSGYRTVD